MRHTRIKASSPRASVVMHEDGLPYHPARFGSRKRDKNYSELPAGLGARKIAVPVLPQQTDQTIKFPTRPILSENKHDAN